jgi:glutathione S-transferase/RNA polymerase-associated protein
MALLLYEHPLSPYAQKCKIALREKGIPFEARLPVGIGSGSVPEEEFRQASPRGEVPALVDGGVRIFDSTIILEYIEDRWPEPPMRPERPEERARVRMLEDVMDTQYEPINWGLGEVSFFGRAKGERAREITRRAGDQVAVWHRYLERQLGSRTWFNGERFGWGDLSVVPYLNGSRGFGLEPKTGTRLADWLARANARESVATTAQEAAASVSGMTDVSRILDQGLFKREYRDHRLEWMIRTAGLDVIEEGLRKQNIRFNAEFE